MKLKEEYIPRSVDCIALHCNDQINILPPRHILGIWLPSVPRGTEIVIEVGNINPYVRVGDLNKLRRICVYNSSWFCVSDVCHMNLRSFMAQPLTSCSVVDHHWLTSTRPARPTHVSFRYHLVMVFYMGLHGRGSAGHMTMLDNTWLSFLSIYSVRLSRLESVE